jgi:phosphoribosylamine--glycine ligase
MPRIKSDFAELLVAAARGELKGRQIEIDPHYAVTVALVSGGYPEGFEKGKQIHGLSDGDELIFHAGTRSNKDNIVTDGGRVLAVSGRGHSLHEARTATYYRISRIEWDGLYFRKDIGIDLINYNGI